MLFGLWERREKKGLGFLTKCHLWSCHLSSVFSYPSKWKGFPFFSRRFSPSKGQGWEQCCFVLCMDRPISRLDITFCFSSPSIHIEVDVILLFDDSFRKVSGQLRSNQQSFFAKVCPSQFSHQELSYFCLFIITHANGIKMVHLNQNLNSM